MPTHNDDDGRVGVSPLPGEERSSAKQAGEGDMSPERKGPSPLTLSLSPAGRGDQIPPSDRPVAGARQGSGEGGAPPSHPSPLAGEGGATGSLLPGRSEDGGLPPSPTLPRKGGERLSRASDADSQSRAEQAAALDAEIGQLAPEVILREAMARFPGELALVSSFGAESAVLLHMAAHIDRHLPVVFVDTLRLFPETLAYRDALVARLGLADVRTVGPQRAVMEQADPWHALFRVDPDRCCHLRKVEPLAEALVPFAAWITGRKRYQATTRAALAAVEADATHIKISPLASWGAPEIAAYMQAHALPVHPLVAQGYPSIGCAPCTTQVAPGEDPRAGRWRGQGKVECGIHVSAARSG
ncbi:phosphoadenylyl-sulfate reductase [Chelatococcus asaccharovorans]|uniref:Adenosine 5'-phosphosulfate reductase n=1 Tax=Chelatococcus asaccharovorans TaxID=28210 RepID=A0A2V3UAS1_9HYPH|nr:phosphoadenylyl-sulfate reductase (thioredoxin) [Chelatococcus asaccharovorans]